jgi:flagellar motor switch protein FliN/FliY
VLTVAGESSTGVRSAAGPAQGQSSGRSFGQPSGQAGQSRGVELLHGVAMEVTVELGRTRLSVRELLALCPGDVLELDRAAGSPADLLVNGRLIARGEVVVVDEDFALRVTEIVAQPNAS